MMNPLIMKYRHGLSYAVVIINEVITVVLFGVGYVIFSTYKTSTLWFLGIALAIIGLFLAATSCRIFFHERRKFLFAYQAGPTTLEVDGNAGDAFMKISLNLAAIYLLLTIGMVVMTGCFGLSGILLHEIGSIIPLKNLSFEKNILMGGLVVYTVGQFTSTSVAIANIVMWPYQKS